MSSPVEPLLSLPAAYWGCISLAASSLRSETATRCPTGRILTPCSGPSSQFSRYRMEDATIQVRLGLGLFAKPSDRA